MVNVKFFIKGTNQEAKFGDEFKIETTLDETNVDALIEMGILEARDLEEDEDDDEEEEFDPLEEAISKLMDIVELINSGVELEKKNSHQRKTRKVK